jgi:hypothetical protein
VRSRIAIDVAATALLLLGTVGANAGEAQFQAPGMDRARETHGAPHASLDRTAFIGTGHAVTNTGNSGATHGVPASPHWSASIGTGHVSGDSGGGSEALVHEVTLAAPLPHWTSKIGTGHVAQSSTGVHDGGVRLTAGK